jgi:hypothetical protein
VLDLPHTRTHSSPDIGDCASYYTPHTLGRINQILYPTLSNSVSYWTPNTGTWAWYNCTTHTGTWAWYNFTPNIVTELTISPHTLGREPDLLCPLVMSALAIEIHTLGRKSDIIAPHTHWDVSWYNTISHMVKKLAHWGVSLIKFHPLHSVTTLAIAPYTLGR